MNDDAITRQWYQRGPEMMKYSLAEWREMKAGKDPAQPTEDVKDVPAVKEGGGRVRHEAGRMNGLEKRYAQHLEMRKLVGEIREYKFESIKLRLAQKTWLTLDFSLVMPDGLIELHDTKGSAWEDDAAVKMKVAGEMYPEFKIVLVTWNKGLKDWAYKEMPRGLA